MQVPKEYCYLKGKVNYGIEVVPLVIKPSNRLLIVNTKKSMRQMYWTMSSLLFQVHMDR